MFFNSLATLVVAILTLVPLWAYLGVQYFLYPDEFWQKVFLLTAWLWILGGAQILFLIVGLLVIAVIWLSYFNEMV